MQRPRRELSHSEFPFRSGNKDRRTYEIADAAVLVVTLTDGAAARAPTVSPTFPVCFSGIVHRGLMQLGRRRILMLVGVAAAVVLAIGILVVSSSGSEGSGPSVQTCNGAVDKLVTHIEHLDPADPQVDPRIVRASFSGCPDPQAWRTRAEHDQIGPKLGAYLKDPTLATDRTLDVLCTHFDAYETTSICKNHLTQ
jgi:hypothetical protein